MTEPITPAEPEAAVPVPESEAAVPVPESEELGQDEDDQFDPRARKAMATLRHEAATNRIALKEAKATIAQLEGAVTRLAAMERAEVERLASEQLIDAGDVWRIDPDTQQSWYDDQFAQLQPDKVRESIEALVQTKPHLAKHVKPPPTQQPLEGLRTGASPEPRKTEVSWQSVLRRG